MKKKQERCRDIVATEDSALNIWNFLPLGKTFFHQDRRSVSVLWIASSQNLRHTSAELQQRFCDNGFDILILWRARYSQCYYLKGNGSDQVTGAFHVLLNYCSHLYKAAFIYICRNFVWFVFHLTFYASIRTSEDLSWWGVMKHWQKSLWNRLHAW